MANQKDAHSHKKWEEINGKGDIVWFLRFDPSIVFYEFITAFS
jgi:hypothetical protein